MPDDQVLARMITTIADGTNGFRHDLLPMALSTNDASATSLLQAILALSSFHLGRPGEALRYKLRTIKSLSESLQTSTTSHLSQLAACMMLAMYPQCKPSSGSYLPYSSCSRFSMHLIRVSTCILKVQGRSQRYCPPTSALCPASISLPRG